MGTSPRWRSGSPPRLPHGPAPLPAAGALRWSNFGGRAPNEGQRRFVSDLDLFGASSRNPAPPWRRCPAPPSASRPQPAGGDAGGSVGVRRLAERRAGPHPRGRAGAGGGGLPGLVRRAPGAMAPRPCRARPAMVPDPRHPHDAGRDDAMCRKAAPSRPVPGDEASLGDGIFPAPASSRGAGATVIGTDSNVVWARRRAAPARIRPAPRRAPAQRARRPRRLGRVGPVRRGFRRRHPGAGGGRRRARAGGSGDCVALAGTDPALLERHGDALLDGWIFAAGSRAVGRRGLGGGPPGRRGLAERAGRRWAARYAAVLRRLMAER